MTIEQIKNLDMKKINAMIRRDDKNGTHEVKDALKRAIDEQVRRFTRLEKSGYSEASPLYRGIEKELYDDKKPGNLKKDFRKLYDYKKGTNLELGDKLRALSQILKRESATSTGTKNQLRAQYERIKGIDKIKMSKSEWMKGGYRKFWDVYSKLEEEDVVAAYGSSDTQQVISYYIDKGESVDEIAIKIEDYILRHGRMPRRGDKIEFTELS